MKNYSITREKAAIELGVSTRTVDRYVKSGKLSYKKIANKVIIEKEEIFKVNLVLPKCSMFIKRS